jgi:hypothetical protein
MDINFFIHFLVQLKTLNLQSVLDVPMIFAIIPFTISRKLKKSFNLLNYEKTVLFQPSLGNLALCIRMQ